MFQGRFDSKLDSKSRFFLPPKWRTGDRFVLTTSYFKKRPCLDLYTLDQWQSLESKIAQLSHLDPQVQIFRRFYLSAGTEVTFDKQNRLLIPRALKNHAELETEMLLVGMGNKAEVWAEAQWRKISEELAESFESTLEKLSSIVGDKP